MSDDGALGLEMHPLLGSLEAAPPAADQDALERLLDGRLGPGSAPPGYGGLARLLTAAAAPAAPDELAGEQLAMATFAAELRSHPPTLVPRRTAAAAHGLGKAAAANLGESAQARSADGQGRESAVGPDATGAARAGLCRAWQAGQGGEHGRRMDAVAFQALVAAAGGADKVAGYCEDVTAGSSASAHGQGRASPPSVSAPPTTVSPPSSGPPADPGPPVSTGPGGQGQGGPPTTTG